MVDVARLNERAASRNSTARYGITPFSDLTVRASLRARCVCFFVLFFVFCLLFFEKNRQNQFTHEFYFI